MKKMNKIYILGTAGSGKTYLAKKLSYKFKIKHYDLDDIYWSCKYSKKRDKREMKIKLNSLIKNKKWIIEGVYGSWIESAIKKADLVIWLDIPFRVLSWRIFKRHFTRLNKKNPESFKDTLGLIKYARKYKIENHSSSYKSHKDLLERNKIQFVILKSRKEIEKFLKEVK
jgi:adenylate kinase family enzyme